MKRFDKQGIEIDEDEEEEELEVLKTGFCQLCCDKKSEDFGTTTYGPSCLMCKDCFKKYGKKVIK